MMLFRKVAIVGSAGALMFGMIGVDVASAGAIAGVGAAGTCTFTKGKASIKPALIIGGTTTPVTTKISGNLVSCSGGAGDGSTVISGKVKGIISSTGTNDCLSLATTGLSAFSAQVKWKTSSGVKLDPTTISFAATPPGAINLTGPNGSIQITLTGTGAATDAKSKPQSFVGNTFTAVATTDQTLTAFTTACTPPSKGLKGFTFNGVNGPSTFSN